MVREERRRIAEIREKLLAPTPSPYSGAEYDIEFLLDMIEQLEKQIENFKEEEKIEAHERRGFEEECREKQREIEELRDNLRHANDR